MLKLETENFKRINKTTARRLFDQGVKIALLPCKMHPANTWQAPAVVSMASGSFDQVCNAYHYYNCNYTKTGKYIAFYVMKGALS